MYVYRASIPKYVVILSSSVSIILLFYVCLGLFNGSSVALIAGDVKPLSYFFSILFFSYYIDRKERVDLVISLLKKTSVFMALVYIVIQVLFFFGKIDWFWFYTFTNSQISPTDFSFRGDEGLFFYKGFMYMVVGLIFWIHDNTSKRRALPILIITVAMILTGTRGFILMLGFIYLLFYGIPLILKLHVKMLILTAVFVFGSIYFFANRNIGDKDLSDSIRVQQLTQVVQDIDPVSFFIGHGFGKGVPIRPIHMEIAYLETFHKQGLLGLCLWGFFFIIWYNAYVRKKNFPNIRKSFLLGVLFMTLLSLTNPFFNNPIGISLYLISFASLHVLNKLPQKEIANQAKPTVT